MKTRVRTARRLIVLCCLACFALGLAPGARAKVAPASLFTDHMVLQQGKPLYVWGTASPGERVEVLFGVDVRGGVVADAGGSWLVELPAQAATAQPRTLTIRGENEIRIEGVLVGEVWVGSGQSNMGVITGGTDDWAVLQKEIAAGKFSLVRTYQAPWTAADAPQRTIPGARWRAPDENSLRTFSAAMVYFARALMRVKPGVPIGLIQSSVGGTNAHAWLPPDAFRSGAGAGYIRRWYGEQLEKLPAENKVYAEKLAAHEKAVAKAKLEKKPAPRAPEPPMGPGSKRRPACLYNGMIAPLQPYAIRGVAWYQGENNSSLQWVPEYAALMDDLINGWRADWARVAGREADAKRGASPAPEPFPFLIVQLPNFKTRNVWPLLREAQARVVKAVPRTALICTIDAGDPKDIHPRNKTPVGERLALAARALAYGENDLVWSGPVCADVAYKDGKALVRFANAGGGLVTSDGGAPRGFEIAGADKKFHPAAATISAAGKACVITLEAAAVPEPVAVRYAWENNPENLNLYNKEMLPAFPFRTDEWVWP